MASDARNHTVPASGDHPSRATLLALALGIRDVIPVSNTTTRAAVITAMASAGVSVSTSNPVYVHRADARPDLALEVTTDGTTWKAACLSNGLETYTPVITPASGTFNAGTTGTVTGNFIRLGPWIAGHFDIVFGGTGISVGTGIWSVTLPVAAPAGVDTLGVTCGGGVVVDASPVTVTTVSLRFDSTTTCRGLYSSGTVGAAAPIATPAAGDKWNADFGYLAN